MTYYNKLGLPVGQGNEWNTGQNPFTPFLNIFQSHGLNSVELGHLPLQTYTSGTLNPITDTQDETVKPIPQNQILLPNVLGTGKGIVNNPILKQTTQEIKTEAQNIQTWISENKLKAGLIGLGVAFLIFKK